MAEAKTREKAKKKRLVEEKKKKKWIKYLQQLWDKVLVENTALLEGTEGFQIMESKHKEIASGDKER